MERKAVLLRIDAALWEAVRRWAEDDLRSVNGQIEFLLREAVARRSRGQAPFPAVPGPSPEAVPDPVRRPPGKPRPGE